MVGVDDGRDAGPARTRPELSIRLFGAFEARQADGAPVAGLGRRSVALLACLAAPQAPWSRDDLAALLWPGRSLRQRRGSLRQELLRLRRALGWPAPAAAASAEFPFGLPIDAGIDVVAFRQTLADPGRGTAAVALYRGDLLQDVRCEPDDPFGDWLMRERAALRQAALDLMLGLLRAGDGSAALARRVLALDPASEEVHRILMRHHAERGDLPRVLEQYRDCAEALRSRHGTDPMPETRALLDAATVALGARPPLPAAAPAGGVTLDWIRRAPDLAPLPQAPGAMALPPVADRPSIAVLPFADLSHDPLARDVLAEGLTEEITNALARLPGFFVVARQSAMAYRGLPVDARRIAAELGVRYLVEGSVEQDGRRMQANLRLIEGRTGQHLWAETGGGPMDDLMAVRDRVVHRLASRLQPRLLQEEIARAVRQPPRDLDAWTWLQRANAVLLRGRHAEALDRVMEPLSRALERDPHYAMALALLSAVHAWRAVSQSVPDPPAEKRLARARAEEALALDPENPFVLVHCAESAIYCAADIDAALRLLELAVARDPNDANGRAMLAHVRRSAGEDPRGSLDLLDEAVRLSPRDPRAFLWHHYANWCHFRLGDLPAMEGACRRSIGLYGRYPLSWIALTSALGLQGRESEARAAATVLRQMRPSFSPDGFYETARHFYGRRFPGQVETEYQALRGALLRAFDA
nr:BTAD domain-containing putative transcriptional regulator [Paracraurococcus ruber]